jgi:hypothetical protein
MCQRLYIASRTKLADRRKTRDASYLQVAPAEAAEVRRHFSRADFPYFYVAEGFAPCGCGFPEDLAGRKARRIDPSEKATMASLEMTLQPAVRGRPRVQLVLMFEGSKDSPVTPGRDILLSDLAQPDFCFRHGEVLTVRRAP